MIIQVRFETEKKREISREISYNNIICSDTTISISFSMPQLFSLLRILCYKIHYHACTAHVGGCYLSAREIYNLLQTFSYYTKNINFTSLVVPQHVQQCALIHIYISYTVRNCVSELKETHAASLNCRVPKHNEIWTSVRFCRSRETKRF